MVLDFQKFNIIKFLTKTNKRIIENIKIITLQNLSKYIISFLIIQNKIVRINNNIIIFLLPFN